jgi:hypothetical protein
VVADQEDCRDAECNRAEDRGRRDIAILAAGADGIITIMQHPCAFD